MILRILILLLIVPCLDLDAQLNPNFDKAFAKILKKQFDYKLIFKEVENNSNYDFTIDDVSINKKGVKSYKEYAPKNEADKSKKIERNELIDLIYEEYLKLRMDLTYISKDSTILNFSHSSKPSFVEIFIPLNPDAVIEFIYVFEKSTNMVSNQTRSPNWNSRIHQSKNFSQNSKSVPFAKMPSEPGKCYAKCLIPDLYHSYSESLIIYTGEDTSRSDVQKINVFISEAGTKWVKKKADRNCLSANPDDCLVWCLIESPEESITYYIVTDTIINKDFEIREIKTKQARISEGGFTEWREVICEADLNETLIKEIHTALSKRGYYDFTINSIWDKVSKDALISFQEDNGLPIGQLDIQTLGELEVK